MVHRNYVENCSFLHSLPIKPINHKSFFHFVRDDKSDSMAVNWLIREKKIVAHLVTSLVL